MGLDSVRMEHVGASAPRASEYRLANAGNCHKAGTIARAVAAADPNESPSAASSRRRRDDGALDVKRLDRINERPAERDDGRVDSR